MSALQTGDYRYMDMSNGFSDWDEICIYAVIVKNC